MLPETGRKLRVITFTLLLASPVSAQVYTDLPGVRPPADSDLNSYRECEQVLVRNSYPFEPTNGPRYTYIYSCRQGDVTVESNQLPPSLEREKRGLDY